MEKKDQVWRVSELANLLHAKVVGSGDGEITHPAPAGKTDASSLTFAVDPSVAKLAASQPVGAVLVPPGLPSMGFVKLEVDNPRAAFFYFLKMVEVREPLASGWHSTAIVSPDARVSPEAALGPYVVVEADAEIAGGAEVHAHSYVGPQCEVGPGTVLMPRVTLVRSVQVGARCLLHSGCVLGADGFGFTWSGGERVKIPQVGKVVLEDDVEIGANTCIDRATCGVTLIRQGAKLDNLVQIGHNCEIGRHTAIAGHTGVSGSSTIGERCTFAGMVGVSDHAEVGDDVVVGGLSGVLGKVPGPGAYSGHPLEEIGRVKRRLAVMKMLPEILQRLRKVEKRLGEEG